MVRTPCSDKSSGLRKGTWTPEEDRKLVAYVTRYGCWNWRLLPKFAGLARCGKSCRLRWMNYLRPDIKRGDYSEEEEETIIRLHQKLGNRWSMIAANLPGRTDNEIKNHWHTALKKRSHDNTTNSDSSPNTSAIGTKTSKGKASKSKKNHSPILKEANNNHKEIMERDLSEISSNNNNITGPIMMSPQPSSSVTAETATNNEAAAGATIMINQQQQHEENNNNNNLFVVQELDDDDLAYFLDAYKEPPVSADFWTEPYLTDVSYVAPPTEFLFDAAPVPLMHQPHHDDHEYYFSPIWDVDYFWGQNNNTTTTFYHQECGGLFY